MEGGIADTQFGGGCWGGELKALEGKPKSVEALKEFQNKSTIN